MGHTKSMSGDKNIVDNTGISMEDYEELIALVSQI